MIEKNQGILRIRQQFGQCHTRYKMRDSQVILPPGDRFLYIVNNTACSLGRVGYLLFLDSGRRNKPIPTQPNPKHSPNPENAENMYIYFYHRTRRAPPHDCGAGCEISDLRDIFCRETKLRGLIRGVLLERGGVFRALPATCAPSPCASKFSGNPRRSLFGGWALPERNVFGGWHRY